MPEWKQEAGGDGEGQKRKKTEIQMIGRNRKFEKEPCGGQQNVHKQEKYDARAKYQKDHRYWPLRIPEFFFGKETSDRVYGSHFHIHGQQASFAHQQIDLCTGMDGNELGSMANIPSCGKDHRIS